MAIEQYTENITLQCMNCTIGENAFGFVYPQGDCAEVDKVNRLLKKAGGKPKVCDLDDYSLGGKGKAHPEFIITFRDDVTTIIVVECKKAVSRHETPDRNHPKEYAVDGVLYYAKFLKESYNVIAVAVSGTKRDTMRTNAFYWEKGQDSFVELLKAKDIILEPRNYVGLVKGQKMQCEYSLDSIRETAIDMHEYLREIKMTERHKPIFIAGILIALNDEDFAKSYVNLPSFNSVISNIITAIENVLRDSSIKNNRIKYIQQAFQNLRDNSKFASIPLGNKKSIIWYIEELEMKIKPMMDHADSTIDALGVFYHEFIKYSGGDGSGLGIVLTPQHLTEFMCHLAGVNKNSKVIDICCGSGAFLVTAMSMMFKDANPEEVERIRKEGLYGIEFDDELYTLAVTNMIIRKDGKSNIEHGDCFNQAITKKMKGKNINIGLINPPYSQEDFVELEFVEHLLDILAVNGTAVVVVPMGCAIGRKYRDVRQRLMEKHTLDAVFSMPDDIFYPAATTNVCVMVWKAHCPHDSNRKTFFGYCKNDGFVKRKKLGRVDAYEKWHEIESHWLRLYQNRDSEDGFSARHEVTYEDEWLCEAYMNTDYALLNEDDFKKTVADYLAYLVKNRVSDLEVKYSRTAPCELSSVIQWKEYLMKDLFRFEKGKRLTKADMIDGTVNYLGAISENNGVRQHIDVEPKDTRKPNCITVNYNGSVGEAFYQAEPFWASDDVNVLYADGWTMNKYIALFIVTVIKANRYRFSYGRKWTLDKMKETILKLPCNADGSPDFEYMERFIKSLPYSDRI